MAKQCLPATVLMNMLNQALRADPVSDGIYVTAITKNDQKLAPADWDAEPESKSGARPHSDAMRAFIAAKLSLQRQYDLLLED